MCTVTGWFSDWISQVHKPLRAKAFGGALECSTETQQTAEDMRTVALSFQRCQVPPDRSFLSWQFWSLRHKAASGVRLSVRVPLHLRLFKIKPRVIHNKTHIMTLTLKVYFALSVFNTYYNNPLPPFFLVELFSLMLFSRFYFYNDVFNIFL